MNGMFPKTAKNQEYVLLSNPIKYTFWLYNPRFWHKNIPFGLMTHVESVVCLSREKADDYIRISVHAKDLQAKAN